jgi:hypothetical protein
MHTRHLLEAAHDVSLRLVATLHRFEPRAARTTPAKGESIMGTAKQNPLETSIQQALADLEMVTDEIRVKLHLAGMDANATWNDKLEPRLFEARAHAKEAKDASKAVIEHALKAFREFSAVL